jgi:hypothetical protein
MDRERSLLLMSYELVFWRQLPGEPRAPRTIYEALRDGRTADAVVELPVEEFLEAILKSFPGATRELEGEKEWLNWVSADERSSFQVTWSAQHVRVDCESLDDEGMNRIIEIGVHFECPLYDPQVLERFE